MRLRKILFSEAAQDLSQKTSSEQKWLVAKWENYIKLNFELPRPGIAQALNEMKTMITSHHTLISKAQNHYAHAQFCLAN